MKDFAGTEVKIGDTVAIVYHPEAYKFEVKAAVVVEVKGNQNMLVTRLINSETTASFLPEKDGDVYPRIVKINPNLIKAEEGTLDAVEQAIHIGDRIACRKPAEAGGNTVKGFELGGKVVSITDHFVFYIDEISGAKKRKGFNSVVVY